MLDTALLTSIAQQMMRSNEVDADYLASGSRISLAFCTALLSRSSASFLFASRARSLRTLTLLCTSAKGFVYF
jgi:hypothetical protein